MKNIREFAMFRECTRNFVNQRGLPEFFARVWTSLTVPKRIEKNLFICRVVFFQEFASSNPSMEQFEKKMIDTMQRAERDERIALFLKQVKDVSLQDQCGLGNTM